MDLYNINKLLKQTTRHQIYFIIDRINFDFYTVKHIHNNPPETIIINSVLK